MKPSSAFTYLLPLFFLMFIFVSCDTDENPVGTLEEAVERIPDVQLIEGADNVTAAVSRDRNRSYFTVTLGNVENSRIRPGTYEGWCLQMDLPAPIGENLSGAKLFDSKNDKIYNKLSYILNQRHVYEREYPGLSWQDIQVAFWVIIETKDMNLNAIRNNLTSSVDGFSESNVNNILSDVKNNGADFEPGAMDIHLVVLDAGDDTQLVGLGETAWAYANTNDSGVRSETFNDLGIGAQWGWYMIVDNPADGVNFGYEFWAGAAQNDFDKGTHIGNGTISLNDDGLTITLNMFPEYRISGWQIHVTQDEDDLKTEPGQFYYKDSFPITDSRTADITFAWESDEKLYIAIHAGGDELWTYEEEE